MAVIAQYDPKQESLDNTIKLVDTGYYEADNGRVKSEFYEVGNEVVFQNKGRRISWKPENMKYLDEFGNEDVIYSVQDVPLEVKANYARFNRSMPDVDDWFIQENDRLKHQIIIQGFQREPMPWLFGNIEFIIGGKLTFDSDLKVVANGIEQTGDFETDGAIHLYDGDTLIFTLPEVVVFDSAYDRAMTFGKYRVTQSEAGEFLFDIVLSNEWVSSLDRVYPIVIDPTVIVSGGPNLTGTSSRKGIQLKNGWLVITAYNSTTKDILLFYSADDGSTWSQLCYINTGGVGTYRDAAIDSYDNFVYLILNNNTSAELFVINAVTQVNVNIYSTRITLQTLSGSASNRCCSVNVDRANKKIITLWTHGLNGQNVFFRTGTISDVDGSVTLDGGALQLTSLNDESMSIQNLCAVNDGKNFYVWCNTSGIRFTTNGSVASGSPNLTSIIVLKNDTTLKNYNYLGRTGWSVLSMEDYGYDQRCPSPAVSPTGEIAVAWHGPDESDSTYYIRFAISTDGINFSPMQKLVPGTNPSLIFDKDGEIYITYQDGGAIKRITSSDKGATWSAPTTIEESGSIPHMFIDKDFSHALVNTIYQTSSGILYDKIVLNAPPNAPYNLTRSNFDTTDNAVFSWTYSDPDPSDDQSSYQLQIIDAATGTIVYDTGKVASISSSHTLPAGTLVNNKQYQWRVKTWDNIDTEGAWSDYATFYTSAKPSVTITNLTEGETIITSSLTVQWSMSDPESEGQSAYQIKLTDMSDTVLYDTGKVIDSVSRSRTLGYELKNNTDYKVKISVWDGKDVKSEEQVISIHVSFTPPAEPNVTTTRNNASITINIEHPTPVDPQPTVIYSDVFRRKQGESNWMRIATGVQNSFTDYTPASGIVYEYKVRAWGDNETYTDSAVVSESVEFTGVWLHDTTDPSTLHQFKYDGNGRSESWQPTAELLQFAGRRLPIAEYDESETRSINVKLQLLKGTEDKEKLEALIKSKNTLCYRDGRGRKMFCHALQLPVDDERYGNTVSLTFEEVSYTEEV